MLFKGNFYGSPGAFIKQTSPSQGQHLRKVVNILPPEQHQVTGAFQLSGKAERS